mgnify:CR=1 FL=1
MTKTAKLNLTFLILAIFSIGGSYAYVLLTNGMELPIYADLLVAQLLILLPAWGYTKKEHINLYKEIRSSPSAFWRTSLSGWHHAFINAAFIVLESV